MTRVRSIFLGSNTGDFLNSEGKIDDILIFTISRMILMKVFKGIPYLSYFLFHLLNTKHEQGNR